MPDIIAMRQFYASRLGRKVTLRLRQLALEHWAPLPQVPIVGFGYATPILRGLERAQSKPSLLAALMPAEQGAIYWPVQGDNRSVLADPLRPPFAPGSLSRLVLLHALEFAENPEELLAVLWQLLSPGGRVLLVVPNRRGLWAHWGDTPFSGRRAYRLRDLRAQLAKANFTLREVTSCLFAPPSQHPFWLRLWPVLERGLRFFFPRSGGVLIVEAEKQIYAAIGTRVPVTARTAGWKPQPSIAMREG